MKVDELKAADKFLLSFPLQPELYYKLWEKFIPLPLIMINQKNEILFGIDLYHFLNIFLFNINISRHICKVSIIFIFYISIQINQSVST